MTEAYSIDDFCQAHGLSRGTFFKLRKQGRAPRTMKVGRRVLIAREAAEEWRRRMETAGAGEAA